MGANPGPAFRPSVIKVIAVPKRLRPTAPIAADAILVGDPGRGLLLAQELLAEPKMSNHARGLWGYSGKTPAGDALTIQATGIGGPSAALVLGDLAELGVRRAVRVGTCVGFGERDELGELLVVTETIAVGAKDASLGDAVTPDAKLTAGLEEALGDDGRSVRVASFDDHPGEQAPPPGVAAADMQSAALLSRASSVGIEAGAILIVAEIAHGTALDAEALELAEKRAGSAAASVLSA